MKTIGIVICNFNKKDYVISCIQSVLESNKTDFDIYVVDNASSDGSAQAIKETYKNKVTLLENTENLGGSGGFNTGLREALKKDYKYLVCLDNDVLLDENAIDSLYNFLEEHPEVGMVGSRVYHMEMPDTVQQFGLNIDFDNYCLETLYENHKEDGTIPEVVYCDAVATCSMMVRTSVVREIGVMPEANFIYWDDIEWGYLCNKAGYKVAVYGASKALHCMGAKKVSESTFPTYYMWRNWIRFFMKYTPENMLESMSLVFLKEIFYATFECAYKGEHKLKETILYAYRDALGKERGKATEGKIFPADKIENKLAVLLKNKKSISIKTTSDNGTYNFDKEQLSQQIFAVNPDIKILWDMDKDDINLAFCESIFHLQDWDGKTAFMDIHENILATPDDFAFIKNYEFGLEYFIYCEQPIFLYKCRELISGEI